MGGGVRGAAYPIDKIGRIAKETAILPIFE